MITQDEPELLIEGPPPLEPTVFQDVSRSIRGRDHGRHTREKRGPRLMKVRPLTGATLTSVDKSPTPLRLLAQSE